MSLLSDGPVLSRETKLDIFVNVVPMVILLFFTALFFAYNPWGYDRLIAPLSGFLVLFPFLVLAVITFLAGRAISRAERTETTDEAE